jgi:predicted metal-binding membrane protein
MNTQFFSLLLKNERWVILALILLLTAFSWWYIVQMDMMAMMILGAWVPGDWLGMFLMWAVMMIAMMLPSATPMILMYGVITPKRQPAIHPALASMIFMLGYLLAWTSFSVLATSLQWILQTSHLLTPMLESNSGLLSSLILILAGIYQWTPWKDTCLDQCRAPVDYLSYHWRPGISGSLVMGLHHGLFCLGCCWMLMLLLFAGGVMNLLLIAAIALFVLFEKVLPASWPVSRASGLILLVAGLLLAAKTTL